MSPQTQHPIPRGLPRLATLALENPDSGETKTELLLKLMRVTAAETKSESPHPFYSIRAVANQFHVPPATVSRIYGRLKSEGVLRTVWGSKTLVPPVMSGNKARSGQVALPVDLVRFTSSTGYRQSILEIQRELWDRGVSERLVFLNSGDELLDLLKRLPFRNVSGIVWLFPELSNKQTILRLTDMGIRVICLTETPILGISECHAVSPDRSPAKVVRHLL